MKRILIATIIATFLFVPAADLLHAQEQQSGIEEGTEQSGVVREVLKKEQEGQLWHYRLRVHVNDTTVVIDTSDSHPQGTIGSIDEGTRILLRSVERDGDKTYFFADVQRFGSLIWIMLAFVAITILVAGKSSLRSLIGLAFTVAVLFLYVFPQILSGASPLMTTVIGSVLLLSVSLPIAHGFSRESGSALLGSLAGLGLVILFTQVFIRFAGLSGLGGEEAMFLFLDVETVTYPVGILSAAIVLGAVGVLDDVAVTQSEIVHELTFQNPSLSKREAFTQAMRIGRHHIASTINTLVLVYAGAALPLILLFLHQSISVQTFLSTQVVAEEVVRTMAGTSGLVLTVPISTWIATHLMAKKSVDTA